MKRFIVLTAYLLPLAILAQPGRGGDNERLIQSLIINSPFGVSPNASVAEKLGVSLRSAAFVGGEWQFSVINKDGRAIWLGINEENEVFPCKIIFFDKENMSVKILINNKVYDLSLSDRASFATKEINVSDELLTGRPRPRTEAERREVWKHATDAQKLEANQIMETAKANGRRPTREEMRRIMDIENSIKVPGGAASGATSQMPQPSSGNRQPRGSGGR